MLSVIVIAIIAMGIVVAVGYGAFSTIRAFETVTMTQRNIAQMEVAVNLVRSSLRTVGGSVAAPMGSQVTIPSAGTISVTTLPNWLAGSLVTPWGAPYAYCPYAVTAVPSGTAGSVTYGNGRPGYAVGLASWPGSTGNQYVVSSDAPPAAVAKLAPLALVLSPLPGQPQPPDCSDVVVDSISGRVQISDTATVGGTATAVTLRSVNFAAMSSDFAPVLYVAPTATGDGSGLLPSSAMDLPDALAMWSASMPRSMTMMMAPGTYQLAQSDFNSVQAARGSPGRGLRLVGQGAASIVPAAAGEVFYLPVDTAFESLTVGGDIDVHPMTGTRLRVLSSSLARISADEAEVLIEGTTALSGTGTPSGGAVLRIGGGRLAVESGAALSVTIPASAGPGASGIRLGNNANAAVGRAGILLVAQNSGQNGVYIDSGSRLTAWNAALATSGSMASAFVANGELLGLYGTSVAKPAPGDVIGDGIILSSGRLDLRSTGSTAAVLWSAASHPLYGIADGTFGSAGGASLSGDSGVFVNAASCFSGALFDAVPTATNPVAPSSPPFLTGDHADKYAVLDSPPAVRAVLNRAQWTCELPPS